MHTTIASISDFKPRPTELKQTIVCYSIVRANTHTHTHTHSIGDAGPPRGAWPCGTGSKVVHPLPPPATRHRLAEALVRVCLLSLTHSFTHSHTHTLTHIHLHTHIHSLTHSHTFTYTLIFTHSLTHSLTRSHTFTYTLTHIHSLT